MQQRLSKRHCRCEADKRSRHRFPCSAWVEISSNMSKFRTKTFAIVNETLLAAGTIVSVTAHPIIPTARPETVPDKDNGPPVFPPVCRLPLSYRKACVIQSVSMMGNLHSFARPSGRGEKRYYWLMLVCSYVCMCVVCTYVRQSPTLNRSSGELQYTW